MNEIWTEKYRPRTLDDVAGQKHVTDRLKAYVRSGSMPHLLFTGPAGTGKTTCSLALAREMFGDNWQGNFIELNASDERVSTWSAARSRSSPGPPRSAEPSSRSYSWTRRMP